MWDAAKRAPVCGRHIVRRNDRLGRVYILAMDCSHTLAWCCSAAGSGKLGRNVAAR